MVNISHESFNKCNKCHIWFRVAWFCVLYFSSFFWDFFVSAVSWACVRARLNIGAETCLKKMEWNEALCTNWVRYQFDACAFERVCECVCLCTKCECDDAFVKISDEKYAIDGWTGLSWAKLSWVGIFCSFCSFVCSFAWREWVCAWRFMCDVMFRWQTIPLNWSLTELFNFHRAAVALVVFFRLSNRPFNVVFVCSSCVCVRGSESECVQSHFNDVVNSENSKESPFHFTFISVI